MKHDKCEGVQDTQFRVVVCWCKFTKSLHKKKEILNGKLNFLFSEYCNKATPRMISVNPFHASGLFLYPRKNFPFSESIERDQWYEIG